MDPVLIYIYAITASVFGFSHACDWLGWRRALLFMILSLGITAVIESIAVATGVIFGSYSYGDALGLDIFGVVPLLVPLTWFMMLYPSLIIALRVVPGQPAGRFRYFLTTAAIGSIAMVSWDLVLDPLMVSHGYWTWVENGLYYGIPLINFIGWWVTSFFILLVFLILGRMPTSTPDRLHGRFGRLPVISYAVTGLISVVVALDAGLVGPSIAAAFAMLPWIVSGYRGRVQELGWG